MAAPALTILLSSLCFGVGDPTLVGASEGTQREAAPAPLVEAEVAEVAASEASSDAAAKEGPSRSPALSLRPVITPPAHIVAFMTPAPSYALMGGSDGGKREQKLGGLKLFRAGVAAHVGYLHGTSDANGLFDRDKRRPDGSSYDERDFAGGAVGATLDLEIIGVNLWVNYRKFFGPGGMLAALVGYDHEFGLTPWLRFDVGGGFGLSQVFVGDSLDDFYAQEDAGNSTGIARTGIEARAMADLQFRIAGPLFTGPGVLLGYHYLWSGRDEDVIVEKGIHYAAQWSLRLDFAIRRKQR